MSSSHAHESQADADIAADPFADLPRDARATRATRLALARALEGSGVAWTSLAELPAWLLERPAARERLAAHAGAWWLAASLRASIDGGVLTRVHALIGAEALAALREAASERDGGASMPRPLLPPGEAAAALLLACGHALLLWSVPTHSRAAVQRRLAWPVESAAPRAFAEHAAWAAQALRSALQSAADQTRAEREAAEPPPPHEADETPAESTDLTEDYENES